MAQLHQMRGRMGRGSVRAHAYAYLYNRPEKAMPRRRSERLNAITRVHSVRFRV